MWLDIAGLMMVGLGTLWGARMGLVRAVTALMAVIVAAIAQSRSGAALGTVLTTTSEVHPVWVADMAGRTLVAFAAGTGVFAAGTGLAEVFRNTPIVGHFDRVGGLVAGCGLGMVAAAWLGSLIAGQPLVSEMIGRSYLMSIVQACLELGQALASTLFDLLRGTARGEIIS